jgi:hypothetical protein
VCVEWPESVPSASTTFTRLVSLEEPGLPVELGLPGLPLPVAPLALTGELGLLDLPLTAPPQGVGLACFCPWRGFP